MTIHINLSNLERTSTVHCPSIDCITSFPSCKYRRHRRELLLYFITCHIQAQSVLFCSVTTTRCNVPRVAHCVRLATHCICTSNLISEGRTCSSLDEPERAGYITSQALTTTAAAPKWLSQCRFLFCLPALLFVFPPAHPSRLRTSFRRCRAQHDAR